MPATPARIAKATVDGVVVERIDISIKQTHVNAVDLPERETFFDNASDAQTLLNELYSWRSDPNRLREAVEFDGSLDLGTAISLTPASPQFVVIDDSRAINAVGAIRSYAANYDSERYAIELIGVGDVASESPLSISGTPTTTVEAGDFYSFTPTADGGETPYSFSLSAPSGVPAGLSFNRQTGELSGTVGSGAAGTLTIGGTPPTSTSVGSTVDFQPTVTGGVPIYEFELDGALPPGLTFDTATGRIQGTVS